MHHSIHSLTHRDMVVWESPTNYIRMRLMLRWLYAVPGTIRTYAAPYRDRPMIRRLNRTNKWWTTDLTLWCWTEVDVVQVIDLMHKIRPRVLPICPAAIYVRLICGQFGERFFVTIHVSPTVLIVMNTGKSNTCGGTGIARTCGTYNFWCKSIRVTGICICICLSFYMSPV